jgi:hypothetical protein
LSHLYGDEPTGNASSGFPHRCPSWSFLIWLSALCIVAGVTAVDGWPECGRETHSLVLVLTMPVALPSGLRCFYPLPCLHTRLLSACEYLWLIRFLPKEAQLLLSV